VRFQVLVTGNLRLANRTPIISAFCEISLRSYKITDFDLALDALRRPQSVPVLYNIVSDLSIS